MISGAGGLPNALGARDGRRATMICPSCGTDLPEGSRYCLQCGAALAKQAAHPEERKVVTTLFCDLVGSTAMGSAADPEDVDALLRRYNALARKIVESHGGTVEKFVGDAVVAVFGVPSVHEDDPERAVRAGLRIVEEAERTPGLDGKRLRLRIGINTGEALVRLDVTPGSGEGFLTGDSVNTAARLQSAAAPMTVGAKALVAEASGEHEAALDETDLLLSQISRCVVAATPNVTAPDGDRPPANGPEPDSKG